MHNLLSELRQLMPSLTAILYLTLNLQQGSSSLTHALWAATKKHILCAADAMLGRSIEYVGVSSRRILLLARLCRRREISVHVASWQCLAAGVHPLSGRPPIASSVACPRARSQGSSAFCLQRKAVQAPHSLCWIREKPHLEKGLLWW